MTYVARMRSSVRPLNTVVGALILSTPLLLGTSLTVPASAQTLPNSPITSDNSPLHRAEQEHAGAEKPDKAPDSLPGAKARTPVAPASKAAMDMAPNDAMFDAINRGDIATV